MSAAPDLLRFAMEGERVRRASSALEQASPHLAAAVRRSLPFLARRGVQVALCFARAIPIADLLSDIARPFHATRLETPAGATGALILDGGAVALLLDGVLGGDGRSLPQLDPTGLTGPQTALVGRVVDGMVRSLSEVTVKRFGVALQARAPGGEGGDPQGAPIACSFEIGEGEQVGRVVLLLTKDAVTGGAIDRPELEPAPDARVAEVVGQVEVTVVAELARVRMSLGRIASLKVGDMLRLDVPVDGIIDLRADGHVVLRGRPVSSAGQIAIRIEGGHGD